MPPMGDRPIGTSGPGERRLDRPPSERYGEAAPASAPPTGAAQARPRMLAGLVALVGAVAIALGGGLLAVTAGLLVIAALTGWGIAIASGRAATSAVPGGRMRRRAVAAALACVSVGAGQLGLWLIARQEGGTLGLIDYLTEVFGILVPLQLVLAAGVAWWRTR